MTSAPFSSWPWENLGVYKYVLYGPLIAKAFTSKAWEFGNPNKWCLHILILFALRGAVHQLWYTFSNMLFLTRRRRIFRQRRFRSNRQRMDWYAGQLFNTAMLDRSHESLHLPALRDLPQWDVWGILLAFFLHVTISEPLFYFVHRAFHRGHLFSLYHSLHHSSKVPQSFTAGFATPLEHLILSVVMGVPLLVPCLVGNGSLGLIYGYVLLFDFLRCMGHSNVEVFPHKLFEALPLLKYFIYTPTYHSVHHMEKNSNFCLFMPLFDLLGGTLDNKTWKLHKEISLEVFTSLVSTVVHVWRMVTEERSKFLAGRNDQVPDFVFLAHVLDLVSAMHVQFIFRWHSSMPFAVKPLLLVFWPVAIVIMLCMWAWSKTFLVSMYRLRGRLHQIWAVPRFGFQYFLPFAKDGIITTLNLQS
uniref:aldehyde oxygenase (deformylating) n=1 Tax=Ananas comosus var. bracteatus TaxID=296719 RepID=A0A6V7PAH0_ANACO|nr:unnamed protein product [Ananas comosus var. bracteatus]